MMPAWLTKWIRCTSTSFFAFLLALATAAAIPMPTSMAEDSDETELLSKVNMCESGRHVRRLTPAHVCQQSETIAQNHLTADAAFRLADLSTAPFAAERCSCMRC